MDVVGIVFAQMSDRYGWHMDSGDGWNWAMALVPLIVVLVVVGAVVWAIVVVTRSTSRIDHAAVGAPLVEPTAMEMLDRRYAQGEMDTAEYEERRAVLRRS